MDPEHELRQEEHFLKRTLRHIKHRVESGFLHKSPLHRRLKRSSRTVIIAALMALSSATSAFAHTKDLTPKVIDLYDSFSANQVSVEQTADRLNTILVDLDKHVDQAIRSGDYHQALQDLSIYRMFANGLGDKDLSMEVFKAERKVRGSMSERIDFKKPGVYTDGSHNHLYVIGSSKFHSLMQLNSLDMQARQDFLRSGVLGDFSNYSWIGFSQLTRRIDGDTVQYCFELHALKAGNTNILPDIARNLDKLPLK